MLLIYYYLMKIIIGIVLFALALTQGSLKLTSQMGFYEVG